MSASCCNNRITCYPKRCALRSAGLFGLLAF